MKNAIFLNKKIGYAALCAALLLLELFCFGKVAKFDRSTAETKEKMKALRSEAAAAYDLQLADDEKLVFWRVEAVNADNHPVGDYVKVCEKSTFGKDLAWYEDTLGYTSSYRSTRRHSISWRVLLRSKLRDSDYYHRGRFRRSEDASHSQRRIKNNPAFSRDIFYPMRYC